MYTLNDHYPFSLVPLPYGYEALHPYIDAETLMFHHDKHLQSYVNNLNAALKDYPMYQNWSLQRLVTDYRRLPANIRTSVRNNAGGVYNHNLYFAGMTPDQNAQPGTTLSRAIDRAFGSMPRFKEQFSNAAGAVFGSGWAWLVSGRRGNLDIITTPNQDTPLPYGLYPIMLIDVWEHAYYLQYQNRRAEYIQNWWEIVNWPQADLQYRNIEQ